MEAKETKYKRSKAEGQGGNKGEGMGGELSWHVGRSSSSLVKNETRSVAAF